MSHLVPPRERGSFSDPLSPCGNSLRLHCSDYEAMVDQLYFWTLFTYRTISVNLFHFHYFSSHDYLPPTVFNHAKVFVSSPDFLSVVLFTHTYRPPPPSLSFIYPLRF